MHSVEWTGSTAALNVIRHVLTAYGSDAQVTRLLDTRCLYVLPRLNPDGADHALREGRFIRSSVRPYPFVEPPKGLRAGDVDGDGRVLFMRLPDPNGPFKAHEEEPRLLVPRAPDEEGGDYYRLLPEGEIEGYDGDTIAVAPPYEALDIGVNLPGEWSTHWAAPIAGPYPGSEPEIAAYLRAVVARPNITGHVGFHTFGGTIIHPPAGPEDLPRPDARAYEALGEQATALTGYDVIAYRELGPPPRPEPQRGWFHDHLGVLEWTTELWNPWRAAGIERGSRGPRWLGGEHPIEDDLRLLAWSDEALGGNGFVAWYAFDHPQLGAVELGGWDIINYWYNPPFDLLEEEVAPHAEWIVFHALASPRLEVRTLEAERVPQDIYRVRLVLENSGWLPTYVTTRARDGFALRPVEVELSLPGPARPLAGEQTTEVGQLEGRVASRSSATWWSYDPATRDRAVVDWLVAAPPGTRVEVVARHARAGTARAHTVLS
jgi:hypothetical protein